MQWDMSGVYHADMGMQNDQYSICDIINHYWLVFQAFGLFFHHILGIILPIDSLVSGWWFGTLGLFSIYWEQSSQLTFIFFGGVETTNQLSALLDYSIQLLV
jgi:hypothetical protein